MKLEAPRYRIVGDRSRFDERHNVQSRNTLQPGTHEYKEFYDKHPEWQAKDDAIRELPGFGCVGSRLDLVGVNGLGLTDEWIYLFLISWLSPWRGWGYQSEWTVPLHRRDKRSPRSGRQKRSRGWPHIWART